MVNVAQTSSSPNIFIDSKSWLREQINKQKVLGNAVGMGGGILPAFGFATSVSG